MSIQIPEETLDQYFQEAMKYVEQEIKNMVDQLELLELKPGKITSEELQAVEKKYEAIIDDHFKQIQDLKEELKSERETVNEIAKQSINQEEYQSKGGDDYDEADHRGGYEECVRVCRETQKQRKVIL